jgi:hypothetical protein
LRWWLDQINITQQKYKPGPVNKTRKWRKEVLAFFPKTGHAALAPGFVIEASLE